MSESLYRLGREAERMRQPEPPATEWWKPRGSEERPAPPDQQVEEKVRPKNQWSSQ